MPTESSQWLALSSQLPTTSGSMTPLDNRGLAYGDGFFTTMAVVDGVILWSDYHQQRLISHAQALQLDIDSTSLVTAIRVHAQQLQQGILKLIVSRATQSVRGYGFSADKSGGACEVWLKATPMRFATAEALTLANDHSIFVQHTTQALCLTSQLACLPPTLAGLKTLNRLDSVLASGELQAIKSARSDVDNSIGEGLLRDMSGNWVEGTMSNVFYQLANTNTTNESTSADYSTYLNQGQWYTPSMSQSGVAGVMRQVLIDELEPTDNPVIIRSLADEDLSKLSRLFFCNAVRGIMPVSAFTLLNGDKVALSV